MPIFPDYSVPPYYILWQNPVALQYYSFTVIKYLTGGCKEHYVTQLIWIF